MDSGILPGVYNHIVIAVHFQKSTINCVCVFHAPFGGVKVGPVELPTDASPASFQTQRTQPKAPARG